MTLYNLLLLGLYFSLEVKQITVIIKSKDNEVYSKGGVNLTDKIRHYKSTGHEKTTDMFS